MNTTETKTDLIEYQPAGVCCKAMKVAIKDNIIQDSQFIGGCVGNLIGIQNLVKGMSIDEVISKFSGVPCGNKPTSCPDQLALCLKEYKAKNN